MPPVLGLKPWRKKLENQLERKFVKKDGGAIRIRTGDLLHAMQARYQLRYSPQKLVFSWTVVFWKI